MMEEWLLMQHSNVYVLFLPAQYFVRIFAKYSRAARESAAGSAAPRRMACKK
jgi:hypothetical protein